jgi:hypothetical protein
MATVTVQDQFNARAPEFSLVMQWREGVPMRLSSLIRERVILEWERREDNTASSGRPLVESKAAQGPRITPGEDKRARKPAVISGEDAVALALQGFNKNAYFVVVDGTQITDLDAEIRMTPSTTVTFVRLVPLVGG